MTKWKGVRVKQELIEQVKREIGESEYKALSEFVSEAIQERLQTLAKQRVSEYLQRDKAARTSPLQLPDNIWTRPTPEGFIEIGVTDHLLKQVKEIVNIRTEMVGGQIYQGEPFGVAESWWFTYDLHSPVRGKVVAVNEAVLEDPFVLNADTSRWIVKIQPA